MLSHRSHNPQTDRIRRKEKQEHHGRKNRNERPAQENDFKGGAGKNGGVKQHDPTEPRLVHFRRAIRDHLLLIAARDAKLKDAQQRHSGQKREENDNSYVPFSSKNPALKPGPKAAASAYSPGFKGRFSSHSWRIKRMVALERLPTFPRISQDGWVWHFVKPSAISTLPSRRAPPGCKIQPLISFWVLPLRWRKSSTSSRILEP